MTWVFLKIDYLGQLIEKIWKLMNLKSSVYSLELRNKKRILKRSSSRKTQKRGFDWNKEAFSNFDSWYQWEYSHLMASQYALNSPISCCRKNRYRRRREHYWGSSGWHQDRLNCADALTKLHKEDRWFTNTQNRV